MSVQTQVSIGAGLTKYRTFNTTAFGALSSPPDSYWDNYNIISEYNVHLNFFEKLWAAWYAWMQNDTLATGIMSFVSYMSFYPYTGLIRPR